MMSHARRALIVAVLSLAFAPHASAAVLVSWNFNDDDTVADALGADLTSTSFLAGAGLANAVFNDNATARGWQPSGSAVQALNNSDYWTFTLTSLPGYVFDLTTLQFDQRRGNAGPGAFQVYVDSTLTGSAGVAGTATASYSTDLSSFTNLTTATLYLVAWSPANNNNNSTWSVDNVVLSGDVRAVDQGCREDCGAATVPEPAVLALLGFGLLGAGAARRRTKQ